MNHKLSVALLMIPRVTLRAVCLFVYAGVRKFGGVHFSKLYLEGHCNSALVFKRIPDSVGSENQIPVRLFAGYIMSSRQKSGTSEVQVEHKKRKRPRQEPQGTKKIATSKKDVKSVANIGSTFEDLASTKKNWAIIPPIDPEEDKKIAFSHILKQREHSNLFIGAHISASGGPENSVINAYNICGQAFALFLKNQRRWNCPPLSAASIKKFKSRLAEYNYGSKYILPHGSFLINVANPEPDKRKRAFENFLDDIKRCEQLGISLYNFHPGSTCGLCEKSVGIVNIAGCINDAIKLTKDVKIVLENAAGQKNVIGSKFEDLRDIINLVHEKSRVGVCLDTCHLFAAGYDIRTASNFEKVMLDFDEIVGLKYLVAVHLNDSKSDLGSGLDRHENIGKGKLTEETFKFVVNSAYFRNMPIILETPDARGDETIYKHEIRLMYSLYSKHSSSE